jgi:hypothetical protein
MAELSQLDINKLEKKVDNLISMTSDVNNRVYHLGESINQVNNDLKSLAESFQKMIIEQRKTAALQQASTELVRVRQELEQNYGNYKIIRGTMLGVLQATDLALVKKTTISRVSEELMLSTPKYWLAPCLVAISAWIGNDRDLAERAIQEAVKRDEERTSLTMALICRRNNKIQTCYEWLSIYFAKQDAANFSEGSFTYIDAYVNGVFGPDDKHMCDDYIIKWINEIRGNSSLFEKEQEELWKGYCNKFHRGLDEQFPDLKDSVQEFGRIDAYVSRINSVGTIADNFTGITKAYVDQDRLKATIDKNLIALVSKYDEEEEPLRREEKFQKAVKRFEGDIDAARESVLEEERIRQVKALNLVERMVKVIVSDGEVSPSEKKTAVSFLSGYIKKGFDGYITEKKADFPESITMKIDGWIGTTTDGGNYNQLSSDYDNYLSDCYNKEVMKADTNSPRNWLIASVSLGIVAIVMLFVALPIGIMSLVGAGICFLMIKKSKNNISEKINSINQKYANMSIKGKAKIGSCIDQWNKAKSIVNHFHSEPIQDIIA